MGTVIGILFSLYLHYVVRKTTPPDAKERELRWLGAKKDELEGLVSMQRIEIDELKADLRLYQTRLAEVRRAEIERRSLRLVRK